MKEKKGLHFRGVLLISSHAKKKEKGFRFSLPSGSASPQHPRHPDSKEASIRPGYDSPQKGPNQCKITNIGATRMMTELVYSRPIVF